MRRDAGDCTAPLAATVLPVPLQKPKTVSRGGSGPAGRREWEKNAVERASIAADRGEDGRTFHPGHHSNIRASSAINRAQGEARQVHRGARPRSGGPGYQSTCTDRSTAHVVVKNDRSAAQASFSSMLGGSDSRASAVSCGADLQPHASRRGAGARRRARSPNRSLAAMGPVRRRLCRRTGGGAVPRRQQTFPATSPTPGAWSAVAPELAPLP